MAATAVSSLLCAADDTHVLTAAIHLQKAVTTKIMLKGRPVTHRGQILSAWCVLAYQIRINNGTAMAHKAQICTCPYAWVSSGVQFEVYF